MILTIPIKSPGWIQILFGSPEKSNVLGANKNSSGQNVDFSSIHDGAAYISKALAFLAEKDVIASCRVQREFEKLYRSYRKTGKENGNVYLSYLWEEAEKVIETARLISSNPNHRLDIDMKSEIKVLSEYIADIGMIANNNPNAERLREEIGKDRDFIQHTISVRTQNMKLEHFNEDTLRYAYLTLLYHLHSFLNAASRLNVLSI